MEKEAARLAEDCPCIQVTCPIHGDCVACVRGHRENGTHVPECMQDILREHVAALAGKVELGVVDARPKPERSEQQAPESESG